MGEAYWRGGVDPELNAFSGYAHGMVQQTHVRSSSSVPTRPLAATPDGGVPSVRVAAPTPGSGVMAIAPLSVRTPGSGVMAVGAPMVHAPSSGPMRAMPAPAPGAARPEFYSLRANDVPKVPSRPPRPPVSFGQRVKSALLLLALPIAAGAGTYAGLVRYSAPPSYVYIANASRAPLALSVDDKAQGTIEAGGSARVELVSGTHSLYVASNDRTVSDQVVVKIAEPGRRILFNVGGTASLAVVTRGYGATRGDKVLPVPAGRLVPLPPDVSGDGVDVSFPRTVTAAAGVQSASVAQLCSYDSVRQTVGCTER